MSERNKTIPTAPTRRQCIAIAQLCFFAALGAATAAGQSAATSSAPPHLISVMIENTRIVPATIQVPAGRVILVVHNHSARRQVAPNLVGASALSVKTFSLPAPGSKDHMDVTLASGTYVLSVPQIQGTCRITVK